MKRALALLLVVACGGSPARTKRTSEYVIAGSLGGIIGASLVMVAAPKAKTAMTATIAAFGAIAVGATIIYVKTDLEDPPHVLTPHEKQQMSAWGVTQQAAAAARKGECAKVRELEPEVVRIDADFHDTVFVADVAIKRCLSAKR